jgi:hypothetical protein
VVGKMWATESEALEKPKLEPLTGDSRVTWLNIVTEIQPFLEAVSTRLSEQIQAFDPEIAHQPRQTAAPGFDGPGGPYRGEN